MEEQAQAAGGAWRVGLVGHRDAFDAATAARIRAQARAYFLRWTTEHASIAVYTMLATGADTLLTEVALECAARLITVVPFPDYAQDFAAEERTRYHAFVRQAAMVKQMTASKRSARAYFTAGKWLIRQVDCVLAVWDGQPARGVGGTGDVVAYARERGVPFFVIDHIRATEAKE